MSENISISEKIKKTTKKALISGLLVITGLLLFKTGIKSIFGAKE